MGRLEIQRFMDIHLCTYIYVYRVKERKRVKERENKREKEKERQRETAEIDLNLIDLNLIGLPTFCQIHHKLKIQYQKHTVRSKLK